MRPEPRGAKSICIMREILTFFLERYYNEHHVREGIENKTEGECTDSLWLFVYNNPTIQSSQPLIVEALRMYVLSLSTL